jgi:hypothetical protein
MGVQALAMDVAHKGCKFRAPVPTATSSQLHVWEAGVLPLSWVVAASSFGFSDSNLRLPTWAEVLS